MKVLFVQARAKKDIAKVIAKSLESIPEKKIGLITTVQFVEQLKKVKQTIETNNKVVVIGKPSGSAILPGQVLGCDVSAATSIEKKVNCFLYVGTGDFHPLGLLANINKPLYVLNPFTSQLKEISLEEKQKLVKKQILRLVQFKDCKTIGILVSTKPGQCHLQANPEQLKQKLEKQGKKVYVFVCDSITNAELLNFPHISGWVNIACPRLAEDIFDKPFVNACEL